MVANVICVVISLAFTGYVVHSYKKAKEIEQVRRRLGLTK